MDKIGARFLGAGAYPITKGSAFMTKLLEGRKEFLDANESFFNNCGPAVQK
jgi:hypothetical protein